ncbi:MAG: hypothetical protein JNN11_00615 [Candidatus Doudnabacteria bacterium]|nr:hypothetical protein [Candidatus Doudnabacteria bacterium]
MLKINKKTFFYSFFISLIFTFGLFFSVNGQALDLTNVRLTVSPVNSADGTSVTFSVTGAQPSQQVCIVEQGSVVGCLSGLTNSAGTISQLVKITGAGPHTFGVRIGGQTGPVAPSASATLLVSEFSSYNACVSQTGDVNGCCVDSKVVTTDACYSNQPKTVTIPNATPKYSNYQQCAANEPSPVDCCKVTMVPSTDTCFTTLPIGPDIGNGTTPLGGNTGVPGYIGNVSTPGWCENDPSLVWDEPSKSCLPKNLQCTSGSLACAGSLEELAIKILTYLLYFAGIIAVIVIVWGGYLYITSAGNEEQAEKGQKAMTNAIIGVVIVIMALVIVRVISTAVGTGNIGQ